MSTLKEQIINSLDNLSEDNLKNVMIMVQREIEVNNSKNFLDRCSLFPITDDKIWDLKERQDQMMWMAFELKEELRKDREQYTSGNIPERFREIFELIMGFFVYADALISENINRFQLECLDPVEGAFYITQNKIELVHQEAYNLMVDEIIGDPERAVQIRNMIHTIKCVENKSDYIQKYIVSTNSKALRYLAAACMEGIFFMGLFAIIFYFRSRNYMPGFVLGNEWIRRDESIHRDFFIEMASRHLKSEESEEALELVREAVNVEVEFIRYLLQQPVISPEIDAIDKITKSDLEIYVKMLADQILDSVGLPMIYNCEIELKYVENTSVKPNFYERKVSQYVMKEAPSKPNMKKVRNLF